MEHKSRETTITWDGHDAEFASRRSVESVSVKLV